MFGLFVPSQQKNLGSEPTRGCRLQDLRCTVASAATVSPLLHSLCMCELSHLKPALILSDYITWFEEGGNGPHTLKTESA